MAVLAAGDVTTQLRIWLNTNAPGDNVHKQAVPAVAVATGLAATTDSTTMLSRFIAR